MSSAKAMSFTCFHCLRSFNRKDNLLTHIRTRHDPTKQNREARIICAVCHLKFETQSIYQRHLQATHHVDTTTTTQQFFSIQEFQSWKSNLEKETSSSFIQDTAPKKLKNGAVTRYYSCHRSYSNRMHKRKTKNKDKHAGLNRTSVSCPARIKAIITDDAVQVQYILTHLGHECDVGRLRLSIEEKDLLAEKLSAGVPFRRILDDIREKDPAKLSRIHLTSMKDLHNIRRAYQITCPLRYDNNDRISVESWICEKQAAPDNPVLFHKKPDTEFEDFAKSDFILVLQFDFQREMLQKFGDHVVCVDGTHSPHSDDVRLLTLLVLDEHDEGVPVAFCFANRATAELYKLFFAAVKNAVDRTPKPFVFMWDGEPTLYRAWTDVMAEAEHQLICRWHLSKTWASNLSKVANSEKRSSLLKTLNALTVEPDLNAFEMSFIELLIRMQEDEETFNFYLYFNQNFTNNVRMWAQCYRPFVSAHANMNLEALHKHIKYEYSNGVRRIRLDKTIHALVGLVQNKKYERWTKLAKPKASKKLTKIKERHKKSTECDGRVKELGFERWSVHSSTNLQRYDVKLLKYEPCCEHVCKECRICLHMLACSCPDNAIRQNICKHIHAVIKFQDNRTDNVTLSPMDFQETVFTPAVELDDSSESAEQLIESTEQIIESTEQIIESTDQLIESTDQLIESAEQLIEMKSNAIARMSAVLGLLENSTLTEEECSQITTYIDCISEILSTRSIEPEQQM